MNKDIISILFKDLSNADILGIQAIAYIYYMLLIIFDLNIKIKFNKNMNSENIKSIINESIKYIQTTYCIFNIQFDINFIDNFYQIYDTIITFGIDNINLNTFLDDLFTYYLNKENLINVKDYLNIIIIII